VRRGPGSRAARGQGAAPPGSGEPRRGAAQVPRRRGRGSRGGRPPRGRAGEGPRGRARGSRVPRPPRGMAWEARARGLGPPRWGPGPPRRWGVGEPLSRGLGSKSGDQRLQKLGHHGESERWERERGCCAGEIK
jgi:hypothetical protein